MKFSHPYALKHLPLRIWRSFLRHGRTSYTTYLAFEWRPRSWREGDDFTIKYPRVESYYDYAFRTFIIDLILGRRDFLGFQPNTIQYDRWVGLFLWVIWLLGGGYRLFPSSTFFANASTEPTQEVLHPIENWGFYDVISPLSLILRIYYHLCFLYFGFSELHYRLNPNFFIYSQARDLDVLPFNTSRRIDKDKWEHFRRHETPAFVSEDQNFLTLVFAYRAFWGRHWVFLYLIWCVLGLIPVTIFHFFLRTPLFHLAYYAARTQRYWSIYTIDMRPREFREAANSVRLSFFAHYWNLFVARPNVLLRLSLDDNAFIINHPVVGRYLIKVGSRFGIFKSFTFEPLRSAELQRLGRGDHLATTSYYRAQVAKADRELQLWIRAKILSKASQVPPSSDDHLLSRRGALTASATFTRSMLTAYQPFLWVLKKYLLEACRVSREEGLLPTFLRRRLVGFYIVIDTARWASALSTEAYRYLADRVLNPIQAVFERVGVITPFRTLVRERLSIIFFTLFPTWVFRATATWIGWFFLGIKPGTFTRLRVRVRQSLVSLKAFVIRHAVRIFQSLVSYLRQKLRSLLFRLSVKLGRGVSALPYALGSSFGLFFTRLRLWVSARTAYREFVFFRSLFFRFHFFGFFDTWWTDDDDYESEFNYSRNAWRVFASDPLEEVGRDDATLDAFDGAFTVSTLYGKSGLEYDYFDPNQAEVPGNFYVNATHHSPLADRAVIDDLFEFDSYQADLGLEDILVWNILIFRGSLSRWLDYQPFYYGDEWNLREQGRPTEELQGLDAPSHEIAGPIESPTPDRGTTELTAQAFANLTHFSTRYRTHLTQWAEKQPGHVVSNVLETFRQGAGPLPASLFSSLTRRDWLELTLFIDSITTGQAAAPADLLILSQSRVEDIWTKFSDKCSRSPSTILERIVSAPVLPRAFRDHLVYSGSRPQFTPQVDRLFRFLLGQAYRTSPIYRTIFHVFAGFTGRLTALRFQFRGDVRLLRLLNLYFGGFLPFSTFNEEFDRLPKSPQSILAMASYFRQLAVEDFEAFRTSVARLPPSSPLFSIFCLSLAPVGPTLDAVRPTRTPVEEHLGVRSQMASHQAAANSEAVYPSIIDPVVGRNRYHSLERSALPPRHPLAALPYTFITDFFRDLVGVRKPHRLPIFGYNFRDFQHHTRFESNKWRPRSQEMLVDDYLFHRPRQLRRSQLSSRYGFMWSRNIREKLAHEMEENSFSIDLESSASDPNVSNLFGAVRSIYAKLPGYFRRRERKFVAFGSGRRAYMPHLDINELQGSQVVGPLLGAFRDDLASLALADFLIPPQFTKISAFELDYGTSVLDFESEPVDLYDEPLAVFLEYSDERWDDYDEQEMYPTLNLSNQYSKRLEDEDDPDNFSAPYNLDEDDSPGPFLWSGPDEEATDHASIDHMDFEDWRVEQPPMQHERNFSNFFFSRDEDEIAHAYEDEDEWERDRFSLADEVSIPISRFFFGGLRTRGAFPATDQRLFMGPMSEQGPLNASLHYKHNFKAASAAAFSTALVPLPTSEVGPHASFFRLIGKALVSAGLRLFTYFYLTLRDLTYGPFLESSRTQLVHLRLHVATLDHYHRWSEVYANKYYFKKFSNALHAWTRDFENYLDSSVRKDQYAKFKLYKVFGLSSPRLKRTSLFARFSHMFPQRSLKYGPGGYHFENPARRYFPFAITLYLRAWGKDYMRRVLPDRPDPDSGRELKRTGKKPNGDWFVEPLADSEKHFMSFRQVEKWSLYERRRFGIDFDIPGSEEQGGGFQDTLPPHIVHPPGGWFDAFPAKNRQPQNWIFSSHALGRQYHSFFSDLDDEDVFDSDKRFDQLQGDWEHWVNYHIPFGDAEEPGDLELAEFSDAEDALLFSYATDADFTTHLTDFSRRWEIFCAAVGSFWGILVDYTLYGTILFLRTYVRGPFHYWVVYSEKFWLTLSLRVGFWVNLVRYAFTFSLLLASYAYSFFAVPRFVYYVFGSIPSTGVLMALTGLFSFLIFLILPYLFFNFVYRYYHSLPFSDRAAIIIGTAIIYFEAVFLGYRPPDNRLSSFGHVWQSPEAALIYSEMNYDLPKQVRSYYDPYEFSSYSQPAEQRKPWIAFLPRYIGHDSLQEHFRSRRWSLRDKVRKADFDEEYYFRDSTVPLYWPVMTTLNVYRPDPAWFYYFLKGWMAFVRSEFITTGPRNRTYRPYTMFKNVRLANSPVSELVSTSIGTAQSNGELQDRFEHIEALTELYGATGRGAIPPSSPMATLQKVRRYHHYPISPINGYAFAGENRETARAVHPYNFRPQSYLHLPYYRQGAFTNFPDLSYNAAGTGPRLRTTLVRLPDFGELMAAPAAEEEAFLEALEDEKSSAKVLFSRPRGRPFYPETADLRLLGQIAYALGDWHYEKDPKKPDILKVVVDDPLAYYDPMMDGYLYVLTPQAVFQRPPRSDIYDIYSRDLMGIDPLEDEGPEEDEEVAVKEDTKPKEAEKKTPLKADLEDLELVPRGARPWDSYNMYEFLPDRPSKKKKKKKKKIAAKLGEPEVQVTRVVTRKGFADDVNSVTFYKFYKGVVLYSDVVPARHIYEATLPEPAEVFISEIDQPRLLFNRHFDTYLYSDWGYRRGLLNAAYSPQSSGLGDFVRQNQYYKFNQRQASDTYFMDTYAKNLRDYLLCFKPGSAYVFNDVYAGDLRLRQTSQRLKHMLKRIRLSGLARGSTTSPYKRTTWTWFGANFPYKGSLPDSRELYNPTSPWLHSLKTHNPQVDIKNFHDITDIPVWLLAQELLWKLSGPKPSFNKFYDRRTAIQLATTLAAVNRHYQFSALAKRFSDFHVHRALLSDRSPSDRIGQAVAFEATLMPSIPSLERSVLDPSISVAADVYGMRGEVLVTSASHPPAHTPYAVGYSHWKGRDVSSVGPAEIYDIADVHPLHAQTLPADYQSPHRYSFAFDSDSVYRYKNRNEFAHFISYPLLEDDYLSALARYELGIGRYIQPRATSQVRFRGIFKPLGYEKNRPFRPRRMFPTHYISDMSSSWVELWDHLHENRVWAVSHLDHDVYPLRQGAFAERKLSAYRNMRRQKKHPRAFKRRSLFRGLPQGVYGQTPRDRRRKVGPHGGIKQRSGSRGKALENFVSRHQYLGQLPVWVDRMLAVQEYNRVHSLRSVYFSEYRKLLLAGPQVTTLRIAHDKKVARFQFAAFDRRKARGVRVARMSKIKSFLIDARRRPHSNRRLDELRVLSSYEVASDDEFGPELPDEDEDEPIIPAKEVFERALARRGAHEELEEDWFDDDLESNWALDPEDLSSILREEFRVLPNLKPTADEDSEKDEDKESPDDVSNLAVVHAPSEDDDEGGTLGFMATELNGLSKYLRKQEARARKDGPLVRIYNEYERIYGLDDDVGASTMDDEDDHPNPKEAVVSDVDKGTKAGDSDDDYDDEDDDEL